MCVTWNNNDFYYDNVLLYDDGNNVINNNLFRYLKEDEIWTRLIQMTFKSEPSVRRLLFSNCWARHFTLGFRGNDQLCKQIYYKIKNFNSLWNDQKLKTTEVSSHGLFSCLKVKEHSLYVGMVNGDIREFIRSEGCRLFAGHRERVTCLDVCDSVMVSASRDR